MTAGEPPQVGRFREIVPYLDERIAEVSDQGWLGEIEGLQEPSIGGATDRATARAADPMCSAWQVLPAEEVRRGHHH